MAAVPSSATLRGRDSDYRVREDHSVEVRDLDFAAYLLMNGIAVADIERLRADTLDVRITFAAGEGTPGRVAELSLAWLNSEAARFASAVRSLKKACRAVSDPRRG